MKSNNVTVSSEDYLEIILLLAEKNGVVRSTDIASFRGVSRACVNKALGVLKDNGLVQQQKYGTVVLTKKGSEVAGSVKQRHKILKSFLTEVLGVNPETAENEACEMEHAMSSETLGKFEQFMKLQLK
ncbi:MAG: metal-dependent transcriptional regulator [Eubacteriales bacterium]|nr:metal-dependent transcriptional regulator [Eubacteriales bacterium]